jgi:predicted nucleic acid-binding OB-fold protein
MKLSPSLVAVKKIASTTPRSVFPDDELEQAAQSILESEGVINPIVVRRKSLQAYEVVNGDFEYYAAARAREIDAKKGEMIGVFIIEPENEDILTKQVQLFRKQSSSSLDDKGKNQELSSDIFETFLINLESRFNKVTHQILEQATANHKLEYEVKELKNQIAAKSEALDVFNNSSASQIALRLKTAGINEKKAANIAELVEKERKNKPFESLKDVVERVKIQTGKKQSKAISTDKMLDIIDTWSKI